MGIKPVIRKRVGDEYQFLIIEELSVATVVETTTASLSDQVKRFVANNQTKTFNDIGFIGEVKVGYTTVNVQDEQEAEYYSLCCELLEEYPYIKDNKLYNITIKVNVPRLNGKLILNSLDEVLCHEVEHAYQLYKTLLSSKSYTRRINLYNFASNNMGHENNFVALIAWVYYICDWHEQDAYANQLYKYLSKYAGLNKSNLMEVYQNSQFSGITRTLNKIKNNIDSWEDYSAEYTAMILFLKYYDIDFNPDDLKNFININIRRYNNKFGKILTKAKTSIIREGYARLISVNPFIKIPKI